MRISPKSGRPVFGHTDVNSGQVMTISYSRPGRGFGNVSIGGPIIVVILYPGFTTSAEVSPGGETLGGVGIR